MHPGSLALHGASCNTGVAIANWVMASSCAKGSNCAAPPSDLQRAIATSICKSRGFCKSSPLTPPLATCNCNVKSQQHSMASDGVTQAADELAAAATLDEWCSPDDVFRSVGVPDPVSHALPPRTLDHTPCHSPSRALMLPPLCRTGSIAAASCAFAWAACVSEACCRRVSGVVLGWMAAACECHAISVGWSAGCSRSAGTFAAQAGSRHAAARPRGERVAQAASTRGRVGCGATC